MRCVAVATGLVDGGITGGSEWPGQVAGGGALDKAVLRELAEVVHDLRKQTRLWRQACRYSGDPWGAAGEQWRRRRGFRRAAWHWAWLGVVRRRCGGCGQGGAAQG